MSQILTATAAGMLRSTTGVRSAPAVFSLVQKPWSQKSSDATRKYSRCGEIFEPDKIGLNLTHWRSFSRFTQLSCQKSDETPMKDTSDNLVARIYKKIFGDVPKSKLKASGYILLTYCAQATELEKFFRTFDMPDTFYSWFLVTELHVWMLGSRLMSEGEYGRIVRNSMVEALWQDCDSRAKVTGDMAMSLRGKQIMDIAEEFQAALFVYDEGLLGNDRELAGALWRRFFLSMRASEENQSPDVEKLALLVNYVRQTMAYLDSLDEVDLMIKTKISWPSLEEKLRT